MNDAEMISRRRMVFNAGRGFAGIAMAGLVRSAPAAARAKSVIYIFNHGGVSHVDTFDPKPALTRLSGEPVPASFAQGLKTSRIDFRKAPMRGSPWTFRKHGDGGLDISELYPNVARHADRLAVVRSCHSDAFDHAPAIFLTSTGSQFPGRPSIGAWSVYGLGSQNRNLPGFVVMSDGAMKSGAGAYGAGFLPATHQGTVFRSGKNPVLNLANPEGVNPAAQRETLDLIGDLNRGHFASREEDSTLEARIRSYELAFRMQSEAPGAVDLASESEATRKLYGVDDPMTDNVARKCLLARRLVERGVRFVQIFFGTNLGEDWDDAHLDLWGSHIRMTRRSDQPIAALLTDLQARGLLDSTLVVWNSEFGRTPLAEGKNGRDHHPYGYSMWMAGAGIKGGRALGATDEFGLRAVEHPKTVHDINATVLRMAGLDHTQLTWRYQGRDQRLTDVHGEGEFTTWLLGGSA